MARVKITPRPPEQDAIQYDGGNEAEVAAFVGFLFQAGTEGAPPAVYDPIGQYLRPIEVGSWVVMTGLSLSVLSADAFRAAYVVVNPA